MFGTLNQLTQLAAGLSSTGNNAKENTTNNAEKKNSVLYNLSPERVKEIGEKAIKQLPVVSKQGDANGGPIIKFSILLGSSMQEEPTRTWKQDERQVEVHVHDDQEELAQIAQQGGSLADSLAAVSLGVKPWHKHQIGHVLYDSEDESADDADDNAERAREFDMDEDVVVDVSDLDVAVAEEAKLGVATDEPLAGDLAQRNSIDAGGPPTSNAQAPARTNGQLSARTNEQLSTNTNEQPTSSNMNNVTKKTQTVQDELYSDMAYSKLATTTWEQDIVWDDDGDEDDGEEEEEEIQHIVKPKDIPPMPPAQAPPALKRNTSLNEAELDIEWEDDGDAGMMQQPGSNNLASSPAFAMVLDRGAEGENMKKSWELRQSRDQQLALRYKEQEVVLNTSVPSILNVDLNNWQWLKSIVWDDTMPPEVPLDVRFILDKNDLDVIVNQPVSRTKTFLDYINNKNKNNDVDANLAEKSLHGLSIMEQRKLRRIQRAKRVQGLVGRKTAVSSDSDSDSDGLGTDERKESVKWKLKMPKIRHSFPGNRFLYSKTEMKPTEARQLHRHRITFEPNETFSIFPVTDMSVSGFKERYTNSSNGLKKADLTAKEGHVILMEYCEKDPPLGNNYGMSSNICNFYRMKQDEHGNSGFVKPELDHGRTIVLSPTDRSPFIASLAPGVLYPAFVNSMFVSPIFQHKPAETDFLLVRPKENGKRSQKAFLREIATTFVLGQIEPQMEVFHPNTYAKSGYTSFLERYMAYHIVKKFTKIEALSFLSIHELFPTANSTFLRKVVKQVAVKEKCKKGNLWKKKPDPDAPGVDDLRNHIQPEEVCCYESIQAGLQRLYDQGIYRVVSRNVFHVIQALGTLERQRLLATQATMAFEDAVQGKVPSKKTSDTNQHIRLPSSFQRFLSCARFVTDQMQLTPWHVTSCYINIHLKGGTANNRYQGATMRLTGTGDPSGRGEGISYLPESEETEGGKKRRRRKTKGDGVDGGAGGASSQNMGYGGTDSDLRKLSKKEAGEVLRQIGYTNHQISLLGRWDRNHIIKDFASSRRGANALGGALAKYARNANRGPAGGAGNGSDSAYQTTINQIFERQIQALSVNVPPKPDITAMGGDSKGGNDDSSDSEGSDLDDEFTRKLEESMKKKQASGEDAGGDGAGGGGMSAKEEQAELERLKNTMEETTAKAQSEKEAAEKAKLAEARVVPRPPGWKPYKILKRTVVERLPNGDTQVTVEYIKDSTRIKRFNEEEKRAKSKNREELAEIIKQAQGKPQTIEDYVKEMKTRDARRAALKDERGRREGLENLKWYEKRLEEEGRDFVYTLPEEQKKGGRCSACNIKGHKPTSVKCPLYYKDIQFRNDAVKAEGMRLILNKKKVDDGVKQSKKSLSKSRKEKQIALREERKRKFAESKSAARAAATTKKASGKKRKGNARSRDSDNPTIRLNQVFMGVIEVMYRNRTDYGVFFTRVNKKTLPTYHLVIKNPMNLDSMKKKAQLNKYMDRHQFFADFELVLQNSLTFNDNGAAVEDAQSAFSKNALRMLEEARSEIDKNEAVVTSLEEDIRNGNTQVSQATKRSTIMLSDTEADMLPTASPSPGPAVSPSPMPSPDAYGLGESQWESSANPFGDFNFGNGSEMMPDGSDVEFGAFGSPVAGSPMAQSPLPDDTNMDVDAFGSAPFAVAGEMSQEDLGEGSPPPEGSPMASQSQATSQEESGGKEDEETYDVENLDEIDMDNLSEFSGEEIIEEEVLEEGALE